MASVRAALSCSGALPLCSQQPLFPASPSPTSHLTCRSPGEGTLQSRHRHRCQSGEEDEDGGLGRGSQSEALEGRSTPPPRPPLAGAIISHCIAPGLIFTDPSNPTRHRAEPFTHFVLFIPHPGPGRVLPTSQVGQLGLSEVSALARAAQLTRGRTPALARTPLTSRPRFHTCAPLSGQGTFLEQPHPRLDSPPGTES